MKSHRNGFSMIEVLVALVFVSFSFLPIYSLFRFGQRGTVSNEKEIEATNYASDLINFMKDRGATDLAPVFKGSKNATELKNDDEIAAVLGQLHFTAPPKVSEGYTRSMTVRRFSGRNPAGPFGLGGMVSDFINRRRAVENYLVQVKVSYQVGGQGKSGTSDDVTLFTIVMD